jgi:hypothetical protein
MLTRLRHAVVGRKFLWLGVRALKYIQILTLHARAYLFFFCTFFLYRRYARTRAVVGSEFFSLCVRALNTQKFYGVLGWFGRNFVHPSTYSDSRYLRRVQKYKYCLLQKDKC